MTAHADAKYLVVRNGTYYLRLVVPPAKWAKYGKQKWESLRTRCPIEAKKKFSDRFRDWKNRFDAPDDGNDEQVTPEQTREGQAKLGVSRHSDNEMAAAAVTESIKLLAPRLKVAKSMRKLLAVDAATLAGVYETPGLRLSQALHEYKVLSAGKWSNLDARSRDKKWRPYAEAVNSFIEVVGDLEALKITRRDGFKFAAHLSGEVDAERIKVDTAKKKIMWLKLILQKIIDVEAPDAINPFEKVTIENNGGEAGKRPAFTEDEIVAVRKRIAESEANEELKNLATIAEWTGTTCKELAYTMPEDWFLDAEVPYVAIRPNAMRAKVKGGKERHRDIPLMPVALEAARRAKADEVGFPGYRRHNGSETLSASFNKLIKATTPGKTWYSYRHRFADVLRRSGCNDTLKDSLMGHMSANRHSMHYGEGYSLKNKQDAMIKAFAEVENKPETN
ncbi:DUF6538 domain-containing protein [Shinella sp. M31]|uniref:DUF6538 domain-containing protein n=1 Tax=Shinella sp. M31 TaxID=3368615 RepID=UPI003BA0483B